MVSVVLLMAGSGSRMRADKNKILLPLGNKLIYEYPLDLFLEYDFEVVCVINELDKDEIIPKLPKKVKYTFGGATRQESVLNGLKLVTGDYVLIHDGARALLSKEVIEDILKNKAEDEAILVCKSVKDTIKRINDIKLVTLNRSELIAAETPQCAPTKLLLDCYQRALDESFIATDDVSLIEKYYPYTYIRLVNGNEYNFKITTPIDYELAKLIIGGLK